MLLALWPAIMWPPKDATEIAEDFVVTEQQEQVVLREVNEVILVRDAQ